MTNLPLQNLNDLKKENARLKKTLQRLKEAEAVILESHDSIGSGYNPKAYKMMQEYFIKYGGGK